MTGPGCAPFVVGSDRRIFAKGNKKVSEKVTFGSEISHHHHNMQTVVRFLTGIYTFCVGANMVNLPRVAQPPSAPQENSVIENVPT